jgi:hypothetical protein
MTEIIPWPKFKFNKKEIYIPAGYYLPPNETISIYIRYYSGKIFNVSIKSIKSKIKKPLKNFNIKKSRKKGQNYEIIVEKAHPLSPLVNVL